MVLDLRDPAFLSMIGGYSATDPDAANYITRVETATGQGMISGVKKAVDDLFQWVGTNTTMTKAQLFRATYLFAGHTSVAGCLVPFMQTANLGSATNNGTGTFSRSTGMTGSQTGYPNTGSISVSVPNGFISTSSASFYVHLNSLGSTLPAANITTPIATSTDRFGLLMRTDLTPDVIQPRTWTTSNAGDTFSNYNTGSWTLLSTTDASFATRTYYLNNTGGESQHTISRAAATATLTSLEFARSAVPVAFAGFSVQIPTADGQNIRQRLDQFVQEINAAAP